MFLLENILNKIIMPAPKIGGNFKQKNKPFKGSKRRKKKNSDHKIGVKYIILYKKKIFLLIHFFFLIASD